MNALINKRKFSDFIYGMYKTVLKQSFLSLSEILIQKPFLQSYFWNKAEVS